MDELERAGRLVHSSNGVPRLKRYVDDSPGVALQDMWLDINRLDAHSEERVGYETQKPLALLERIIAASSEPGGTILDPFCGTGTAMVAAERLDRGWIGMDTSLLGCSISLARVRQALSLERISLVGFPATERDALRLKRAEPVAYGMWGTSMLATLAERENFTEKLAMGTGRVKLKRRIHQIISWVPLTSRAERAIPRHKPGRLAKVGFVLEATRSDHELFRWLRDELEIPLEEVTLDTLVETEALKRGLAGGLRRLAA